MYPPTRIAIQMNAGDLAFLCIDNNKIQCFHVWQLVQQLLPLTHKPSAHITLMCFEIYKT